MELNSLYLARTGEAMRLIHKDDKKAYFSLFEGDYVMDGDLEKLEGFMEATGMKPVDEENYKLRVVSMRAFQDMKNDDDYPYTTYLEQYDEMKGFMTKESIESFFTTGGGFRTYEDLVC
jgi:hypothetical protein